MNNDMTVAEAVAEIGLDEMMMIGLIVTHASGPEVGERLRALFQAALNEAKATGVTVPLNARRIKC